jgi:hypothetical protein
MSDWYHLYLEQQMGIFRPNIEPWNKLCGFDQTTLWWLLKKEKDIKVGTFKDNLRWNYYHGYEQLKLFPKQKEIIRHYSYAAPK